MFYKAKNLILYHWFNVNAKNILHTPPVECHNYSQYVIVTQLCHRDIFLYLFAIKSFTQNLGPPKKVYVLDDGSLTNNDKEILFVHVNGINVIPIYQVVNNKCPRGKTWERLLFIADNVQDAYIIQLDADTLTISDIPEVRKSIDENQCFTMAGDASGTQIITMLESCEKMQSSLTDDIQVISEKKFSNLVDYKRLNYVRGCSAFAGFGKGSFSRSQIELFSEEMENIIGSRWSDWGSEQVTSNYMIANASCPGMVLPYPKYCAFTPSTNYQKSSFLHFIGLHRFKNNVYIQLSKFTLNHRLNQLMESTK